MTNIEAINLYRPAGEFSIIDVPEHVPMVQSRFTYEIVPGNPFDVVPFHNTEGSINPVHMYKGRMYRGEYVTKKLRTFPEHPEAMPDEIVVKHRILQMLGVPVCRNMWHDGNGMVVMTDVRRGGLYGVASKHAPLQVYTPEQLDLASFSYHDLAIKAYAEGSGVFLNHDAYTLLVVLNEPVESPSRYRAVMLDIGIGTHCVRNNVVRFTPNNALQEANHAIAQIFMD
ncbi:MAG: hypothetical protein NUV65_01875 [Candidatus Roizmanbacteria bacterium]|nr:hypothetical protein [Candidatus Roizmanbacteria bacterium]